MNTRHTLPGDIERTSMSIIAAELAERGIVLPPEQEAVVKRVIHTTADFDYANNLRFTPGAAELGQAALKRGVPIVTDTNMAKAGISKPSLEAFGCTLHCFMAEPVEEGLRPALVIAVPVGFVNVVESKELLFAACEIHGVPAIAAMGRKGGSNVAAAICNALLYAAAKTLDPAARGWQ